MFNVQRTFCDSLTDVSNVIKCICPSVPDSDFPVEAQLHDINSLQSEKNDATEHLKIMLQDNYPFSIFWKWHIKSDKTLFAIFFAKTAKHHTKF